MNRALALLAVLIAPSIAGDFYGKDVEDAHGKDPSLERLAQSQTIANKNLSIGTPVQVGGVTIYPVIDETAPKLVSSVFVGFFEGLADGSLQVCDVNTVSANGANGGYYSSLQLTNHS